MSAYDFTLKFAIPQGLDRRTLEDRLFEVARESMRINIAREIRRLP